MTLQCINSTRGAHGMATILWQIQLLNMTWQWINSMLHHNALSLDRGADARCITDAFDSAILLHVRVNDVIISGCRPSLYCFHNCLSTISSACKGK